MDFDDFEELAKLAYRGEELSDFAPLPTKYMYIRLSVLYDCFARGKYSKGQCIELKNKFISLQTRLFLCAFLRYGNT